MMAQSARQPREKEMLRTKGTDFAARNFLETVFIDNGFKKEL
jgi:hypothetical protein